MKPITANIVKYTIQPEGEAERDVTQFVKDWDGLEVSLIREGNSGVLTELESTISLVGDDKAFVQELFEKTGVRTNAIWRVYRRRDFSNDYDLVLSAPLDFASYSETDTQVDIECDNNDLFNVVKSSESTKYEIPLDDVADRKRWAYQRMDLYNTGNYTVSPGDNVVSRVVAQPYLRPMVYLNNAEMVFGGGEDDFKTQNSGTGANDYFFKSFGGLESTAIHIDVDVKIRVRVEKYITSDLLPSEHSFLANVFVNDNGSVFPPISSDINLPLKSANFTTLVYEGHVKLNGVVLGLKEKESLVFMVVHLGYTNLAYTSVDVLESNKFLVQYLTKGEAFDATTGFKVVQPKVLLQKFLDKMGGVVGRFTGNIVWRNTPYNILLVPAESIRNKIEAKINGSFKDFVKWMNCLGYEFEITGNTLTFRDRNYFYDKQVNTLTLQEHELADLVTSVNADECYTVVNVGYEQQDYDDSPNGAYESFGTYEYTTGFEYSEEIELDLISPYRADPIGIELLLRERNKETTSDSTDKDIFFVAMKKNETKVYLATQAKGLLSLQRGPVFIELASYEGGTEYEEYRDETIDSGLIHAFNAPFHPRYLVNYNASLIGVNATQLTFAGTEAYSNATSSAGTKLYEDVPITHKLHDPIEYNFAAGYLPDLPDDKRGLVHFTYKGKKKQGFIKQVVKNYSKEQSTEWILYKV